LSRFASAQLEFERRTNSNFIYFAPSAYEPIRGGDFGPRVGPQVVEIAAVLGRVESIGRMDAVVQKAHFRKADDTRRQTEEILMAILQSKPKADDGIPPMLDRRNGAAKPDVEALLARIAQLEAQVACKATIKLKVSEKGALSVYGLQRFPISLYRTQWEALLDHADAIREFIAANADKLSTK
jgi:hypothetical protein